MHIVLGDRGKRLTTFLEEKINQFKENPPLARVDGLVAFLSFLERIVSQPRIKDKINQVKVKKMQEALGLYNKAHPPRHLHHA